MLPKETDPPSPEGGAPEPKGSSGDRPNRGTHRERILARKNRELEKQLAGYKTAEEKRTQDGLSDLEKAQAEAKKAREEAEALKAQNRSLAIQHQIEAAAAKAGAVNAKTAFKLTDLSGVELDEAGNVVGLEDLVGGLKEAHGYLFSEPKPPSGGGGNPPSGNPASMTADRMKSMSSAEFKEFAAGVQSGRIKPTP